MQRPEVVFYVLASSSQPERQDFACKLIEKIYRSGEFCYVLTDHAEQADQIDKLLWTFRPGSFVPHQIYQGELPAYQNTVLIGGNEIPPAWRKFIVNLSAQFPNTSESTLRILEILDNSNESKQAGRQRYRHYLETGLEISTQKNQGGFWVETRSQRPD